jgi:hypothetical protein
MNFKVTWMKQDCIKQKFQKEKGHDYTVLLHPSHLEIHIGLDKLLTTDQKELYQR